MILASRFFSANRDESQRPLGGSALEKSSEIPTKELVEAGAQMPDLVVSKSDEEGEETRSTVVAREALDYEMSFQERAELQGAEMAIMLGGLRQ